MSNHNHYWVFRQYAPLTEESPAVKTGYNAGEYQYKETRELVQLVQDAAHILRTKGEAAFAEFRLAGSRWRQRETYIFVLDPEGNMIVHADPAMEGKNQLNLKDINGKPIIRGLLGAAMDLPDKPEGWYHYQWPVPGGLLPRWKSSYVQLVKAPSGKNYIIGSGMYNDRMEREFVVDLVTNAVGELERDSANAIQLFHDPTGPFIVKDAYIFVLTMDGIEMVNPAFPSIEGSNLLDYQDSQGKFLDREIIQTVQMQGSGWVDYMWPKPGESVSTQKSAYVRAAHIAGQLVGVGCGVYLANAPRELSSTRKMTAQELMSLVRDAADILVEQGESAYPEFRTKGSKWFRDDTYLFIFSMDGTRFFHAAEPRSEGQNDIHLKDVLGRPIVKMILDAGASSRGEGWVHYLYPEPGDIFPVWKSSFVKRVTFPSGKQYIVGCGIYKMQMDKAFIEDVVNRAAALIANRGQEVFDQLRDKTGPFVFMDTYIFVETPDGTELVNPAMPSLEGRNLIDLKDLRGREVVKEEIAAAMTNDSAWIEIYWYHPGDNLPALKQTFVRKVQYGTETYIVGSGFYGGEGPVSGVRMKNIQNAQWQTQGAEKLSDTLSRQMVFGEKGTMARFVVKRGTNLARHYHMNEEYLYVMTGALQYNFDDRVVVVNAGDALVIPSNIPHSIVILEDAEFIIFFTPGREDWLRGEDQYLRK